MQDYYAVLTPVHISCFV